MELVLKIVILRISVRTGMVVSLAAMVIRMVVVAVR